MRRHHDVRQLIPARSSRRCRLILLYDRRQHGVSAGLDAEPYFRRHETLQFRFPL
jgi:hypothetical protein